MKIEIAKLEIERWNKMKEEEEEEEEEEEKAAEKKIDHEKEKRNKRKLTKKKSRFGIAFKLVRTLHLYKMKR